MKLVIRRAQIGKARGVDTTVKSAKGMARHFAPTWEMVMGYKNGTLTQEAYTEQYLGILRTVPREAWLWLRDQAIDGEITVLCYCRDDWFCHTHLLIDYLCRISASVVDGRK